MTKTRADEFESIELDEEVEISQDEEAKPPSILSKKGKQEAAKPPSMFSKKGKPRQYIHDRCLGKSQYHPEVRPPSYICFVPNCVYWWSNVMEQNRLCESSGRIGVVDHDKPKVRKRIFSVGLAANIAAFILTFFACFSISYDYNIIQAASFSKGIVSVLPDSNNNINRTFIDMRIDVGLRAVSFVNPNQSNQSKVVSFDTFCYYLNRNLNHYMHPEQCGDCQHSSKKLVASVIISLLLVIPSITTDVLRMYPNYDVNCQKFYGSIVSTLSMFFSLYAFLAYNRKCFSSFYHGQVPFYIANETAAAHAGTDTINLYFDWKAGNALLCMYAATSLKIVDIVANLLVPTPSITRDHDEQERYEALYHRPKSQSDEDDTAGV